MADTETLLKQSVGELDKLLKAQNVIGEPTTHGGVTVIPLVSFGFGFGTCGGTGKQSESGAGTGGGGGIRPVAVIIVDKEGARIQSIRGANATMLETLGETVGNVVERVRKPEDGTGKSED
ncbi:MAG: spore germination protein GerW family protein [Pseudomonadota bacterium]